MEDNLQIFTHLQPLLFGKFGHIATQHGDGASLWRHHVEDFEQRGGLSATRLTDQGQTAAFAQREINAVHRKHRTNTSPQHRTLHEWEGLFQSTHLERDGLTHRLQRHMLRALDEQLA